MATQTRVRPSKTSIPVEEQARMVLPADIDSSAPQKGVDRLKKERKWGANPAVFINMDLRSLAPDVALLLVVVAFNKSSTAERFYTWLNANYTPFMINFLGTFAITSLVYWAYGGLYAILDLTKRPAFLQKYKIQPYKEVTAKEYREICKIALRNQVFVSLPMSALSAGPLAHWRGMGNTSYAALPGFWVTLGTYVFCLLCEECVRSLPSAGHAVIDSNVQSWLLLRPPMAARSGALQDIVRVLFLLSSSSFTKRVVINNTIPSQRPARWPRPMPR